MVGAHTLGHVHTANSGYGNQGGQAALATNSWDGTPHIFDNNYFRRLLGANWVNLGQRTSPTGSKINTWGGPANTVMLNADMNMAYGINASAATNNYIGSVNTSPPGTAPNGQSCVTPQGSSTGVCINPSNSSTTITFSLVRQYAQSQSTFFSAFATSLPKLLSVGYNVASGAGTVATSKSPALGTLTRITLA